MASVPAAESAATAPQIIILSPRLSLSPSPAPPPTSHLTSLTRLASLSNYLLARRRSSSSSPPAPPTDQPDWTELVTLSDQQIQDEVQRLIVEERAFTEQQEREQEEERRVAARVAERDRLATVSRVLGLDFSTTGSVPVLGGEEAEEEAEQQALFVESLRAGEGARARRLSRRMRREREEDEEGEGEGESFTAFQQFLSEEMDRQGMLYGDGEERTMGGEGNEDEYEEEEDEDPWSALNEEEEDEGPARDWEGRPLWRNNPISIPRLTPSSFNSHPPSRAAPNSNSTLNLLFPSTTSSIPSPSPANLPIGSRPPNYYHILHRSYSLRNNYAIQHPLLPASEIPPAAHFFAEAQEALLEAATRNDAGDLNSQLERLPPPNPAPRRQLPRRSTTARRTREETTTLMGRTLRMKKGVWALYCGGSGSAGLGSRGEAAGELEQEQEELPSGFHWSRSGSGSDSEEGEGEGCGALVCARGLKEGQKRVFVHPTDEGEGEGVGEGVAREEQAISTDLPLSSTRVGALDPEGRRIVLMGKKCKGCEILQVGCRACGNPLAYLHLHPCLSCPSQHPPSVGGGAMMDGLLWHFRAGGVRARVRRVGKEVGEWWDEEGEESESEEEKEVEEREEGERIEPREPKRGEGMKWRDLPTAQAEFEASLIGEPSDWTRSTHNEQEEWWITNGVAKHCPAPRPPTQETESSIRPPPSTSTSQTLVRTPFDIALESDINSLRGAPPAPPQPHVTAPPTRGASLSRRPAIRISPSRRRARDINDEGEDEGEGRRVRRRIEETGLRDTVPEGEGERGVGYGSAFVGRSVAEGRRRMEVRREGTSIRAGR